MKANKHCFIEGERPCTIKCRAAYKSEGGIYCSILWTAREFGYALTKSVKSKKER